MAAARGALPVTAVPHSSDAGDPARIRVVVVDDSVVVRGLFSRWLSEVAEVEIVGIHRNGLEAVRQVGLTRPDLIILDIEMPEMDGLTALPLLLEASPASRVLVVSSMSIRGADVTLRCLMRGASDYLPKPSGMREVTTSAEFREALVARVLALGLRQVALPPARHGFPPASLPAASPMLPRPRWMDRPGATMPACGDAPADQPLRPLSSTRPRLLLVGASTGGPQAVATLLGALKSHIADMPVVVVQHMPATITMLFADHLRRHSGLDTLEIGGGEVLRAGVVHVVRGGHNLILTASGDRFVARAVDMPGAGRWMPSVDLLFASASEVAGAGVLAAVLTGMGDDGVKGARAIAEAGGSVVVQDEASSIVWGMPGAIARAGVAAAVLDLPGLARLIGQRIAG